MLGKKFYLSITIIFTVMSAIGFSYAAHILFVQIPSGTFYSSHGWGIIIGFLILGFFIVVGIWASVNQIRLWKIS